MTEISLTKPAEEISDREGLKNALLRKTPNEIEQWVDENVTDITEAKDVIAKLAVAVSILAKRAMR